MNVHLTAETLDRLGRGAVPQPALASTVRHLRECEACARRAQAALQPTVDVVREVFSFDEESPHIDPQTELAQYVDGTLEPADREIVETHLDACAMCRAEVDDLMALARPPARRWRTLLFTSAAVAAAIAIAVFLMPPTRTVVKPRDAIRPGPSNVTTAVTVTDEPTAAHRYSNEEWDGLVREALRSGRLPLPDLRSLSGAADPLRGPADPLRATLVPAGVVVDDARPRFSWTPSQSATYIVTIFDGDREIAQSDSLTDAHWTPRSALRRGRTYVWQVAVRERESTAIVPAPPAPPAMFRITSERDHRELAEAQRLYPNDHLLHAVLAARAGLRAEAAAAVGRAGVELILSE